MSVDMPHGYGKKKAIVVGGSLGGLFAGNVLRSIGWDVQIYERSRYQLGDGGGGIVLHDQIDDAFRRCRIPIERLCAVPTFGRRDFNFDGSIGQQTKHKQRQSSWAAIYTALRDNFPSERYHLNSRVVNVRNDNVNDCAIAEFEDGKAERADILIGADGGDSVVRNILYPNIQSAYAGYCAFRGLVPESELDQATADLFRDHFCFYRYPSSHILCYLIAGNDHSVKVGQRRFNWVWYQNVSPNQLQRTLTDRNGKIHKKSVSAGLINAEIEKEIRETAEQLLSPPFRTLVRATGNIFIQKIEDLDVDHMFTGRIALVGDAAFIPRPHTAASTAKAASNALALADALTAHDDITRALAQWELTEIRYGRFLRESGQRIGDESQWPHGRQDETT